MNIITSEEENQWIIDAFEMAIGFNGDGFDSVLLEFMNEYISATESEMCDYNPFVNRVVEHRVRLLAEYEGVEME